LNVLLFLSVLERQKQEVAETRKKETLFVTSANRSFDVGPETRMSQKSAKNATEETRDL